MSSSRVLQWRAVPLAIAALALAACGGDATGPGAGTFDAAKTSASLDAAAASRQSAAYSSFSALSASFAASGAIAPRVQVAPAAMEGDRTRLARTLPSFSNGAPPVLPPASLGTTYTWDLTTSSYVLSGRTGAPSNGVRFILYAVDPVTREPVAPLNELGYADVIDIGTSASTGVHVVVVSGGVTYVVYTVSATASTSGGAATLAGYVTNGTERANFSATVSAVTTSTGGATINLDYTVALPQRGVTLVTKFSLTGTDASADGTVSVKLTGDGHTVALSGSFTTGSGTLDVKVDGKQYATITGAFDAANPTIKGTDGNPLSDADAAALQRIFGATEDSYGFLAELGSPIGI